MMGSHLTMGVRGNGDPVMILSFRSEGLKVEEEEEPEREDIRL
jgi:hypothetical protein